ncbi:UDP-glycosyltransferase UGT5-like [Schistocerca piceifrons]|uniref:UDP-glycosyltransferase UGT5-like n=1 Tax=Schistocerca piceifrons TaxID=274613 RepID=UPI001F5F1CED|nr:UDP-glycosyltransferase UGT5-like [Schistocerca piceifrons]
MSVACKQITRRTCSSLVCDIRSSMALTVFENKLFLFVALTSLINGCVASKILVVVPAPSISHQKPFHILTKALLQRGHQVTLFTANPMNMLHENLTEIDLSVGYKIFKEVDLVEAARQTPVESLPLIREPAKTFVRWQLSETAVQDFIKGNHTFDLVIMELMPFQAFYGLVHKVGSPPLVGMITLSAFAPNYLSLGNPMNPAYVPDVWVGYSDHMNFWQRLYNTYFYLVFYYTWYFDILPNQEAIRREYFGPDGPSVYDTNRNFSLFILNNHFATEYPRPHLPSVVEITGIHIEAQATPLPKDIQEFMDGAEHGVVYFSLGSNVKSNSLPWEKIQAFLDAFRELPQRVLWKWENDSLPGQPDNVMINKWLPQQGVLSHPKVRLFITQGGLQSMNEATYHAVPFLAIPFFSDQAHNAAKIAQAQLGVRLDFEDVTKETLLRSSRSVLEDPKYKENMRRMSAIFREHQADSLERAVWWVEYVIRHKGAPHMRSAALDLHWWQFLLLDVIAFILVAATAVAGATFYLVREVMVTVKKGFRQKGKKQ